MRFRRDRYTIEAALDKGRAAPEWAEEIPEISAAEEFYLQAFWDLNTERSMGGALPWGSAVAYAERAGLDEEMVRVFWRVMRKMDEVFFEFHRKPGDRNG